MIRKLLPVIAALGTTLACFILLLVSACSVPTETVYYYPTAYVTTTSTVTATDLFAQTATVTVTIPDSDVPDISVKPGPVPLLLASGVYLAKLTVTPGVLDTWAYDNTNFRLYQVDDKCFIVNTTIRNDNDYDVDMDLWAIGYDAGGEQVGFNLIPGALKRTHELKLLKRTSFDYTFLLNWSSELNAVRIMSNPLLVNP